MGGAYSHSLYQKLLPVLLAKFWAQQTQNLLF